MTIWTETIQDPGAIDYAAIEREAYRMRAEAMRAGTQRLIGWFRAHLHRRPRRGAKHPA